MAINSAVLVIRLNGMSQLSLPRLPLAHVPDSDLARHPGGSFLFTVH